MKKGKLSGGGRSRRNI